MFINLHVNSPPNFIVVTIYTQKKGGEINCNKFGDRRKKFKIQKCEYNIIIRKWIFTWNRRSSGGGGAVVLRRIRSRTRREKKPKETEIDRTHTADLPISLLFIFIYRSGRCLALLWYEIERASFNLHFKLNQTTIH